MWIFKKGIIVKHNFKQKNLILANSSYGYKFFYVTKSIEVILYKEEKMSNSLSYIIDGLYYKKLFHNARDILLLISEENGEILDANNAAVHTYGYNYDKLIGMKIHSLRRGETTKEVDIQISKAAGEGVVFETTHYKEDGSHFPVEVSSINIGEDKKVLLSIIRDITERKEKEEQIKFYENRVKLLYETMTEGCALGEIITDNKNKPIDYKYVSVNESFARLVGLNIKDIIGKCALQISPELNPQWIAEIGEVAKTGISKKYDYYHEKYNKYLQFSVYSPKEGYFAILFTDITELKLKERELTEKYEELSQLYLELTASEEELKNNYIEMGRLKEEADTANSAKSLFLANLSHEIRTPLTRIMGVANLLEITEVNEEHKEYVKIIMESGTHLLDIIDNMLDISKIEVGELKLNSSAFNLKRNIENVIKSYIVAGANKGIEVMYYIDPSIDEIVIGDEIRLKQIIINLIENAMKYTEKGYVLFKVKLVNSEDKKIKLQFSIQDTGIGISEGMEEKLFKIFIQGDSSYTKKYGGTGLGLVLCKEFVSMMNGSIWYKSNREIGTTFYFTAEFTRKLVLAVG